MDKYTEDDGWDCVPELKEAVDQLSCNSDAIYEIKNCVRQSQLDSLVDDILTNLRDAIEILEGIDTSENWITEEED